VVRGALSLGSITPMGRLKAVSGLHIADEGMAFSKDMPLWYNVRFQMVPAGQKATFRVASSSDDPVPLVLPWGS
jgi:hypothetical protein